MSAPTFKKLKVMVDDLRVMQVELLPNAKDDDASIVPDRNMDEFQKKKLELNLLLSELNKEVQRLNELRAAAPETRDQATIRLYSENSKNLQQAGVLWKVMKDILIKDESRKRLDEKLLADRKKMMTILAKEIQELSNKNAHVKGLKQSETANTLKTRQEDRARKRREEKQKREERRKREKEKGVEMEGTDKKKKRGSSTEEPEIDIDDGEAREMKASSEQEQQFFNEVEEAKKEQDVMLEEIMSGMNELHSIATEMNQTIKTTTAMAEELDQSMDATIQNFKSANKRLQEILEESGGLSRWCPMMICIVLLLALVGYMFQTFR